MSNCGGLNRVVVEPPSGLFRVVATGAHVSVVVWWEFFAWAGVEHRHYGHTYTLHCHGRRPVLGQNGETDMPIAKNTNKLFKRSLFSLLESSCYLNTSIMVNFNCNR